MKIQIRPLLMLAALSLTAGACAEDDTRTVGNGIAETRSVALSGDSFDEIVIRDVIGAEIIEDDAVGAVLTIRADSNLLSYIRVVDRNGDLEISIDGDVDVVVPIEVTIPAGARSYDAREASTVLINRVSDGAEISASGAANVRVNSVLTGVIAIDASEGSDLDLRQIEGASRVTIGAHGAANVAVAGTCDALAINASGAGNVEASGLACLSAQVTGSDAAEVRFCAADSEVQVEDAAATFDSCND